MDPSELLADLTDAQREAVRHVDGPLLVLAGPGSGKTRVITRRVAHLIAIGVPAWQILAVTFTNKAAGEMRERIDDLVPADVPGRSGLVVATFHSLCARLLRRHAVEAGLDPAFVIFDSADQRELVKEAIVELGLREADFSAGSVHSAISRAKNDLLDPEAFERQARDYRHRQIARVYAAYQRALAANKAVDFDDLLLRTARLLVADEPLRQALSERFRYLLIDEYQDTNQAQFAIARAIAGEHRNICVVGDPDQSIYGWRGADLRNILQFEERFPNVTIVPLGENFRSTAHIVGASAALIANNHGRRRRDLFTALEDGERVQVRACADEHEEAAQMVEALRERFDRGVPFREMAVLYRINALSRVLEDALRRAGMPYQIARGTAFFDRKEIRDALAYLRLLANPSDSISLGRIVNVPPRGLGETSLDRIEACARRWGIPMLEALGRADEIGDLTARARAAAAGFHAMLERWRRQAEGNGRVETRSEDPGQDQGQDQDRGDLDREGLAAAPSAGGLAHLVRMVIEESGLLEHYRQEQSRRGSDEGEDRLANLDELISAASEWRPAPSEMTETALRPLDTLADRLSAWLENVALVSDADAVDASKGAVTLMTLHAAKGLEFDSVYMVGLEEGTLPHQRFDAGVEDLEEERRLCYVGMTRARRRLWLSWARCRAIRGASQRRMPSTFLDELPEQHVQLAPMRSPRMDAWGSGRHEGAWDRANERDLDGVDEIPDWEAGDLPPRREKVSEPAFGGLTVGTFVVHEQFGPGRVEAIMPRGRMSTALVNFEKVGRKSLVLAYAKLEVLR